MHTQSAKAGWDRSSSAREALHWGVQWDESPLAYASLQALRCCVKACLHVMFCWHTVAAVVQFTGAAVAAEKRIWTAKARTANETGVMMYAD